MLHCFCFTHLKACGSRFARRYFSLIVDSKFRHHGDGGLDDEGDDVGPHLLDVHAFSCQPVQHAGERALAACALAAGVDLTAEVAKLLASGTKEGGVDATDSTSKQEKSKKKKDKNKKNKKKPPK